MENQAAILQFFEKGDPAIVGIAPLSTGNPIERPYRHYHEARTLEKHLPRGNFSMLEIGCGSGRWAFEFAPRLTRYVGLDLSTSQIAYAQEKARKNGLEHLSFLPISVGDYLLAEQADGTQPNVQDQKFDVVYFSGVSLYLEDDVWHEILEKLKVLLSEKSLLVERTTTSVGKRIVYDRDDYYAIYRTDEEIADILIDAGFEDPYIVRSYPFLSSSLFTRSRWFRYIFNSLLRLNERMGYELMRRFFSIGEDDYIVEDGNRFDHKFFVCSLRAGESYAQSCKNGVENAL